MSRTDDPQDPGYHAYDNNALCTCGHERWDHSLMATRFVDVGCRMLLSPPAPHGPYECHCPGFTRAKP